MPEKNLRRHRRILHAGPVRVSWQDRDGIPRYASGKCLNVSESGLLIELPELIPIRTQVTLKVDRLQISGSATVKHVTRKGLRHILGLELNQAVKFELQLDPALELQEQP